jgi:drug/metabolite transporter (DMT)-like permease
MRNAKLLNYLHLHFIVFIWGFTAILGALISIDAIPLVWYRMLLATGLVLMIVLYRKESLKIPWKTIAKFCAVGFIIALHWLAFFSAIKVSNVSVTLAVMSTGAFFASFLEPIMYRRKVKGYEVFFGLIVVIGLYVIFKFESNYFLGILLALASSFLGALFSVFNGKFVEKHSPSVITFYELLAGVFCITVFLFFKGSFTPSFFKLTSDDWLYLIILASFCTAYAFIASVHVMKWISPYTVMLTTNMEPVYGILLALVILGDNEYMSPQFYYGALIIFITVIINGYIKTRIKKAKIH